MRDFSLTRQVRKLAVLTAILLGSVASVDAKVIYVNGANPTPGNGTTWAKAFEFLQDALDIAGSGDSVYIAKGTYFPDDGGINPILGDREMTFVLNKVNIYGGFVGNETSLNQRNPIANPTILSGEIWTVTPETLGYERYWSLHVVTLAGNATIDGVTIEKGRANGDAAPFNQGGGCLVPSGMTLTLANSRFRENFAAEAGGAIHGKVIATNCVFEDNEINNEHLYAPSSPKPKNWLFSPNCSGGAIAGDVTATKCQFLGNHIDAQSLDLGITTSAVGGAISGTTISLRDCLFDGNQANSYSIYMNSGSDATSRGGAVSGKVSAANCTFINNTIIAESTARTSPDRTKAAGHTATPTSRGGAIAGQVNLVNCSFDSNNAVAVASLGDTGHCEGSGGAVYLEGASNVTNCTFSVNNVTSVNDLSTNVPGFTFSRGGGVTAATGSTVPISDCTFLDNGTSYVGSAIYCGGSVNVLSNVMWYDLPEILSPFQEYSDDEQFLQRDNMIYVASKARISNRLYPTPSTETSNILKGGYDGIISGLGANYDFGEPPERTLIDLDPMFANMADPVGPDLLWRTPDDGLRLTAGSPAIGIGKTFFLPKDVFDLDEDGNVAENLPFDNAGYVRVQQGTLDLGAYEFGNLILAPEISVEQPLGTILVDGISNVDLSARAALPTTFVIKNQGTRALSGLKITGEGPNISNFTFTQPSSTVVAAGASTSFSVTFNPSATGLRKGTIHIFSNDANESPFDIDLSGNSQLPDIAVSLTSGSALVDNTSTVDFGPVGASSSATKSFTIRNTGLGNLGIQGISSVGANAANFIVSPPVASFLAGGASTTFNVTFRPSGAGVRNASFIVVSNDPDAESSYLVKLTGTGFNSPEIVVKQPFSPEISNGDSNNFGSVVVSLSYSKTFIIKNTGLATLKNISVAVSGSPRFKTTKFPVKSLKPGKSKEFQVTFKPTDVGTKTATLVIRSNDSNESVINVELTGKGITKSSSKKAKKSKNSPSSIAAAFAPAASAESGTAGTVTVVTDSNGSNYNVLTVRKSADWNSTRHAVQVSSDLVDWFSGSKHTTTLVDSATVLKIRDNTPVTAGEKRYIRLK